MTAPDVAPSGRPPAPLDGASSRVAARQQQRRRQILESTRQLLRSRGWHAVAIDEIGEAAGLTGPAVYRYFDSKEALLTEAMSYAAEQLWSSLPDAPDASLDSYVRGHVDFVLDNADLVELWYRQAQHLAPEVMRTQRRLQRTYMERWVTALQKERPDLSIDDARLMVRGAVGLIHSVAHRTGNPYERPRDRARVRRSLTRMALAALES
jgi:AcrR family transcriptional regulator